jgi:hypothetical protein
MHLLKTRGILLRSANLNFMASNCAHVVRCFYSLFPAQWDFLSDYAICKHAKLLRQMHSSHWGRHTSLIRLLFLLGHLHLSGMFFGAAPRTNAKKHVFKRHWITCSKYDDHSRLSSQHIWRGALWLSRAWESSLWWWIRYWGLKASLSFWWHLFLILKPSTSECTGAIE